MKQTLSIAFIFLFTLGMVTVEAGNPERRGQAGATELLINPWPRIAGWHGANMASVQGVEAIRSNVGGLVSTDNLEMNVAHSKYLLGSGITMNSFGFSKTLGERNTNAIGVSISSFNIGQVQRTTVQQPEGGIGTFNPSVVNITTAYSKRFSNAIKGGAAMRVISESLSDVSATGVAIDAGIQYSTRLGNAEKRNSHFGVALRNVGTPMQFGGDGLSNRATIQGSNYSQTMQTRSSSFEIPSLLSISVAQDIYFGKEDGQRVSLAGKFTSNSFTKDQYTFGVEYGLNEIIHLRGGLLYEDGIFQDEESTTVYTGPSGGFSIDIPFGEKNEDQDYRSSFTLDYSFRATKNFDGVHSIGVNLTL